MGENEIFAFIGFFLDFPQIIIKIKDMEYLRLGIWNNHRQLKSIFKNFYFVGKLENL